MRRPRIFSEDYDGSRCPMCESTQIQSPGSPTCNDGLVLWPMTCHTCQASWDELYGLSGYNLEDEGVAPEPDTREK